MVRTSLPHRAIHGWMFSETSFRLFFPLDQSILCLDFIKCMPRQYMSGETIELLERTVRFRGQRAVMDFSVCGLQQPVALCVSVWKGMARLFSNLKSLSFCYENKVIQQLLFKQYLLQTPVHIEREGTRSSSVREHLLFSLFALSSWETKRPSSPGLGYVKKR